MVFENPVKKRIAARLRQQVFRSSDFLTAAKRAQLFGDFVSRNYTGPMEDLEIESFVEQKLTSMPPIYTEGPDADCTHVITNAQNKGGHTRLLLFFLRAQKKMGLRCTVIISRYANESMLTEIQDCAENVIKLDAPHEISKYNLKGFIFLHIDPNDIFSALAASRAKARGQLTFFVNHADHAFSFGVASCDVVLEVSGYGWRNTELNRTAALQNFIGLPVKFGDSTTYRSSPRRKFLTIGRGDKLRPCAELNYAKFAEELFGRTDVTLDIIGQTGDEPWWDIVKGKFPERISFQGMLPYNEVNAAISNSDGYIDSFPMTGGTILSEVAAVGVPVFCIVQPCMGYSAADAVRHRTIEEMIDAIGIFVETGHLEYDTAKLKQALQRIHSVKSFEERLATIMGGGFVDLPKELYRDGVDVDFFKKSYNGCYAFQFTCETDLPVADRIYYSYHLLIYGENDFVTRILDASVSALGKNSKTYNFCRRFLCSVRPLIHSLTHAWKNYDR